MFELLKNIFGGAQAAEVLPTRRKADITTLLEQLEMRGGGIANNYASYVADGYKKHNTVYGAINLMALNAACVPWVGYKVDGKGDRDELERDHPLSRIMWRPNPRTGGARFIERLVTYMYIAGKTFVLKSRSDTMMPDGAEGRKVRALWNLRPDTVKLEDGNDPSKGWQYRKDPTSSDFKHYEFDDILPFYLLDPADEWDGLSPIQVAALTIDQGNLSRTWNKAVLKNSGRTTGIFRNDSDIDLPDEEIDRIINKFMTTYGGPENAGRPMVLQGKLVWQATGMSPSEMEWLDGQRVADRNTAFTFGVPSVLTGDNESATHRNYEEARRALYQDKIIPLLTWIRDELNVWLAPEFGPNLELDLNIDNVSALQENENDRWERVGNAGWLSINEQREAVGYEEWGPSGEIMVNQRGVIITKTDILIPATLLPIGSAIASDGNGNGSGDGHAQAYVHLRVKQDGAIDVQGRKSLSEPDETEERSDVELVLDGLKQQAMTVQSVVCAKSRFKTAEDARRWIRENSDELHTNKVDETETSWRFRQFDPSQCTAGSFRSKRVARGVTFALCKKQKSECQFEGKAFNLPTHESKTAYWKALEREREPFVRLVRLKVLRQFGRDRQGILTAVRQSGMRDVEMLGRLAQDVVSRSQEEWLRLYESIYLTVGEHFARRVLSAVPPMAGLTDWAQVAVAVTDWKTEEEIIDPFSQQIRAYLGQEAGKKITGIGQTTLNDVRKALVLGVEAGEGTDQIAARLDKFLEQTYLHRSEVVARTEVVSASSLASDVAARATGVATKKEWIATRDDRIRDTHLTADDQVASVDEPFNVGGYQMLWPGDTSFGAPAKEICNCRCAVGYLTE